MNIEQLCGLAQYNTLGNLFKRNSVYVSTIFVGAFAFGIGFDTAMTKVWEVSPSICSKEAGAIGRI